MMNRARGIFEVVYFVLGGLLLFIAIDVVLESGFSDSWYYFLFSLLAFVMYFYRRSGRLKGR
jgi:hypothetical protein